MTILSEIKTDRANVRTKLRANVGILQTGLTGDVVDPTSLARKANLVEQFWKTFDTAHVAYMTKLNPEDDQQEVEMEF